MTPAAPPPHRPPRSESERERAAALQEFERAAARLFTQSRPSEELSESEVLALQLALRLGSVFVQPALGSLAGRLRAALNELNSATLGERRGSAVRAIMQWAPAWQAASERNRAWVVRQLLNELSLLDPAFEDVNSEGLSEKLAAYSADAARGPEQRSAERILAEIISEDCDALGLASDPSKSEQADVASIHEELLKELGHAPWAPI